LGVLTALDVPCLVTLSPNEICRGTYLSLPFTVSLSFNSSNRSYEHLPLVCDLFQGMHLSAAAGARDPEHKLAWKMPL